MAYTDYLDSLFGRPPGSTPAAPSALASLGDQGTSAGSDWALPLPQGGVFGQQKWAPGNGTDVFTQRGTPVYAMFDGTIQPYGVPSPAGQVPGFLLNGAGGYTMQGLHARPMVAPGTRVRKGQQIAIVDDPGLDILGQYQGMPDNFQHLDLTIGRGQGPFQVTGGDVNASQWLQQAGYGSPSVGQTRGPNSGPMPGGGMPNIPGGMGMGGLPGMGGAGGGMFGGMPGMGGFPGMGMGMPPMMGGGGMMGMPALPPLFGGPAYPGQGFMGFGQGGLQQGLVPGTMGVGSGMVTSSPGQYPGAFPPMLPLGAGMPQGGGFPGMGSPFGGFGLGGLF